MKHLVALALVAACTLAEAGTERMVAQCEEVMRCDICRVELDRREYTTERKLVLLPPPVGARQILVSDYNWIRNANNDKLPDGRFLMCARVAEAMSQPDSDRGIAARALFDPNWAPQSYCPAAKR